MTDLENSARKLFRATYAPIRREHGRPPARRAWEKYAIVANARITEAELKRLRHPRGQGLASAARTEACDAIADTLEQGSTFILGSVKAFANVSATALKEILEDLVQHRSSSGARLAQGAVHALEHQMATEPVGFLHLERLNFVPAGIERGELVYSVPLSPGEEVNISHKEWASTSEEFSTIVTDFMEAYSEEGVTEKSDISQSSSSQEQHSSGFNTGVTASGGYGPVTITTSLGYNVASSASQTEQAARAQSTQITRKASARTRKEHKTSFKVASAAGTEDQQVRKLKNPFTDRATRVDYYQLIRKWRIDLYRYGVRLTYDLTIPEPGSDILARISEIEATKGVLQRGFDYENEQEPWAKFDLKPSQITRASYLEQAAIYDALVDPPPPEKIEIPVNRTQVISGEAGSDSTKVFKFIPFGIEVPTDYVVEFFETLEFPWDWGDPDANWQDHPTWLPQVNKPEQLTQLKGASGKFSIVVSSKGILSYAVLMTVTARLKDEAFHAWQLKTRDTLRDAAKTRYEERRQYLKQRLESLMAEMGSEDPLSLRKIEREEVMKATLRWLFGPDFALVPPGLPPTGEGLYEDVGEGGSIASNEIFTKVAAHGEVIKFLHHAIEWENMLYILYPYFWSGNWALKKYLNHPDPMHRVFLKSGAARVVLTIRPGFETDFVSFMEQASFDPSDDQYLTIAQEMQNYARTNYPGIRPANPVEGARPLLTPRQRLAWDEMQKIIALLETFRDQNGAYPTTEQGLAALAPLGVVPAADPWGNPYTYESPSLLNDFELVCLGADGVPGGEGEDADIASSAEASLIGRWFEYTPTSALDIAFDVTTPSA